MDILKNNFGILKDGRAVEIYELKNSRGTTAKILTYGARLQSLIFNGVNIVLGHNNISAYENDTSYLGAIVGRCANRIGGAKFELNGKTFLLDKNDGNNHLHGGFNGFEKKIWAAEILAEGLKLSLESPDGEGGYPGNLKVSVIYNLTDNDELEINYKATSDENTLCNLTNHSYFNLNGAGDILNQKIQILAENYTWANSESIPDGRILPVANTPLDLRELTVIGEHIDEDFDELNFARGYDHNFCVGELGKLKEVARAQGNSIALKVFTTQPGLHFYSGNFLENPRSGFALETQFYPNAINIEKFDKPILKAAEVFNAKTIFKILKTL